MIALPVFALFCQSLGAAPKVVTVSGPTVIAFFPPMTQAELAKDPDSAESLADFRDYVARARPRLHDAQIDFDVIYASSFAVKSGSKIKSFHPKKDVGYYFVEPGRPPRIEYGVMTDWDILNVSREYFRRESK
jgi:hypothetical protein